MCGGGSSGPTEDQEEDERRQARINRERRQSIINQQTQEAAEFRGNLPGLKNEMGEGVAEASRQQLAGDLAANTQDASHRGLLYSKLKDAREGGLRAEAGAGLAKARSNISTGLEGQAREMETNAINGGLADFGARQKMENDIYTSALANVQRRNQQYAQIGAAGGKIAGAAAGAG